jgi:hypothetical protein
MGTEDVWTASVGVALARPTFSPDVMPEKEMIAAYPSRVEDEVQVLHSTNTVPS